MRVESILLSIAKATRSFIFTSMAITIPYFLSDLNFNAFEIGIIVLISLAISTAFLYIYTALRMIAKEKLILMGSLFLLSLIMLYFEENLIFLIIALVVGAFSLSGRDLTANQSIEQYTMSTYTEVQNEKNTMFAVYNFGSYLSGAVASLFFFVYNPSTFQFVFLLNVLLALSQLIIYSYVKFPAFIPRKKGEKIKDRKTGALVKDLAILFSIDSIGGGFVNSSIITLYFKTVYNLDVSQVGFIFIIVNLITALSIIMSKYLSGSIGLVRTMVYTHVISNIMLFMVPVFHMLLVSEMFLYIRQSTSQMDVPARDSFVNTIIPAESRIESNSVFIGVRNGMQIPGPGISGFLMEVFPSGVFFGAALTKIVYDVAFFLKFKENRV
ncbi:MAG: MFS transporter [Thermoplasmataceae archaeon]